MKVIGTLGLLTLGKEKGVLKEDIENIVKDIEDKGFFVSDKLKKEIIKI